MSYGLVVTPEQVDILEIHDIDYVFWDFESILLGDCEQVEVEFESEEEFDKALALLEGGMG